ncbi:MAG TPA: hypothetical protein VFG20_16280 [Planctomycetaceae bacterium]|jgi:hypothetical protein|nr:hypothetical protein [Planctomycetaceae bacterium]
MSYPPNSDAFAITAVLLAALAITIVALSKSPSSIVDQRLVGTWQSDAERTIAELYKDRPLSDEQHTKLRNLFGKLRVNYTRNHQWTSDLEGFIDSGQYRIVKRDGASLVLRSWSDKPTELEKLGFGSETIYRIEFDGAEGYWLINETYGLRERFRRIP